MHSSRMRTGHSLTVCCSLLPGGDVCMVRGGSPCQGGLPAGGSPCLGGCLPGPGGSPCLGGCLPGPGRVLPAGGGGVCLVLGGCLPGPGVVLPAPGVSAWCWGGLPGDPLPPLNRITDTCKTITLATTSLRPVINFCKQCISLLLTRRAVFLVRFRLSPNLFFCVTFN